MALPDPVILVPGITATYLADEYPLPPETVWTGVARKDFERISLHPNDLRYEAQEPARISPSQLNKIAYGEIIEELRHDLSPRRDRPVPVYPFAYDWRLPLKQIETQLADFVEEVIDRTTLMRHYSNRYAKRRKVNLVGHSMGGLVIAGYLASNRSHERIHKVVTLASPFQGSFEAVIKVTTGTANLGTSKQSSREREAARLTPSLYHLIPDFTGAVNPQTDLFKLKAWPPSVLRTIEEYVRKHGVSENSTNPPTKSEKRDRAKNIFRNLLTEAREYRSKIDKLNLREAGIEPEHWLCVIGVDAVTRVRLKVEEQENGYKFAFRSSDRQNKWDKKDPEERKLTGDGTVPFNGAVPKFLPFESLVCVTPHDYGYWELKDKTLASIAGFHGILPNMNLLHRLIVRHLIDRPDPHGNTWARRPPGVTSKDWNPPIPGLREK